MRRFSSLAVLLVGLVVAGPAWAQRGPRDSRGHEPQAGRGVVAESPFRDGLVPGGLNAPRPGVDLFRATPDTFAPSPVVPWLSSSIPGPRWGAARTMPSQPGAVIDRGRIDQRGWRDGGRRGGHQAAIIVPYPLTSAAYGNGSIYLSPYYVWPGPQGPPAHSTRPADASPTGFLRLMVTPRNASVIVDGIYEGLVDDFGGSGERPLVAGVRHVRLEADGYEPVEFDVRVPENDTIILRRDLYTQSTPPPQAVLPTPAALPPVPRDPAPAPAASAATAASPTAPKTIYVIPRCYLGNTPPKQAQLPPECHVADVRTIPQ